MEYLGFATLMLGMMSPVQALDPPEKAHVTGMTIKDRLPSDSWRPDVPVWTIEARVCLENRTCVRRLVHRQDSELRTVEALLKHADVFAPSLSGFKREQVKQFLRDIVANPKLVDNAAMFDFLSLNKSGLPMQSWCGEIPFFKHGVEDFIKSITIYRQLPSFTPEFEAIAEDWMFSKKETALECYVYLGAMANAMLDTRKWVVDYLENYVKQMPDYESGDDADVLYPGQVEVTYPEKWLSSPVHFQPGGYKNGRNVRLEYISADKFLFLNEGYVRDWLKDVHTYSRSPNSIDPTKILDIGAGCGLTTLVYASIFPQATVIGIDLAAPFVRFSRHRAMADPSESLRGHRNVRFYQGNAERLWFADASFDIVHFTYVLHEMEAANGKAVLSEAMRLLKPGAVLVGFEVPYIANPVLRATLEEFVAWSGKKGDEAYQKYGFHGPEPFVPELERLNLPRSMASIGFLDVNVTGISMVDCVLIGRKASVLSV